MTTADPSAPNPAVPNSAASASAAPAPAEPAALLCPRCGYDLRGAAADRCSECGLAIDRAALAASGVPWAHRRRVGRVRAFAKTVWLVTFDARRLRHELAKPQDPRDARRFQAVVFACLAAALLTAAGVAANRYGLAVLAAQPRSLFDLFGSSPASGGGSVPNVGTAQDAVVPWCAGATLVPALPVYLLGLAGYSVGVGRATVRLRGRPADHRERARAVARYAAAPLVWMLPAAVAYLLADAMRADAARAERLGEASDLLRTGGLALGWSAVGLTAAAALTVVRRWGQWAARAHHAGAGRFAAATAELVGRSVLGWALFLGVAPWCVGLLRIIWGGT